MYRPDYRRYAILPPSRRRLKTDPRVQKRARGHVRQTLLRMRAREKGLRVVPTYY